ncbi:MAG: hypothetical protein M0R03_21690 [Novosphingobium sp.]|nr:hypothetical protein [Novosphingobium sp.]
MSKPVFYQAELKPLTGSEVLELTNGLPISERMGDKDGKCPECGLNKWWLLPKESIAVIEGGKPYCECLGCGYKTHL